MDHVVIRDPSFASPMSSPHQGLLFPSSRTWRTSAPKRFAAPVPTDRRERLNQSGGFNKTDIGVQRGLPDRHCDEVIASSCRPGIQARLTQLCSAPWPSGKPAILTR